MLVMLRSIGFIRPSIQRAYRLRNANENTNWMVERIWLLYFTVFFNLTGELSATDLTVTSPLEYQVIQRETRVDGRMAISGELIDSTHINTEIDARLVVANRPSSWQKLETKFQGNSFQGVIKVPAGGWYRIEVRARRGDELLAEAAVGHVGVGEVFLIAGQSYAAGANDELLKVTDPLGQVTAFDVEAKRWQVAHDPQPHVGDGGTIWPAFGDQLRPLVRVPIGLVNVARGGTSSRQWLPDTELYKNLEAAGKTLGRFRAVLWQQGESDVIEKTSTDLYVRNMTTIRHSLATAWGWSPIWLPAKSTLHPTVYNDPESEGRIRAAIDELWKTPGFRPGPDTDQLIDENRGGIGSRRHFTGVGQRRAATLWLIAVWNEIHRQE